MCRLLGYAGPPIPLETLLIQPDHSLLEQAQHATEAKLAVNGDGFGMAWYAPGDPSPALYRDVLPAWADGNLPHLARCIRASRFIAHVRAGTFGASARTNCHPFAHGRWSFAHNGQIAEFRTHRRALESLLPDDLYAAREGTTDSEVLFLMLLTNGLDTDPDAAFAKTTNQIEAITGPNRATRIAALACDGTRLIGFRWAGDARAPTLYRSNDGQTLASEPLDGQPVNWGPIQPGHTITLGAPATEPA